MFMGSLFFLKTSKYKVPSFLCQAKRKKIPRLMGRKALPVFATRSLLENP